MLAGAYAVREIVPIVMALAEPTSVIDIGCGGGCWLAVFREHGVTDFLGVDGCYVDRSILETPEDRFLPFDLSHPLKLDRRYVLVISLEVAEHLPPESAEAFVESLTRLVPVILFSVAIPFQKGMSGMRNLSQVSGCGAEPKMHRAVRNVIAARDNNCVKTLALRCGSVG